MENICDAPGLMPIEQAKKIIEQTIVPISELTHCHLNEALDRITALDIVSPINVPAYDNSAMDGYALNFQDIANSTTLEQIGKSFAGNQFDSELAAGQCVRIMTGAQIPKGADTVVMQENTTVKAEQITFTHKITQGSAIRPAGDDIKKGAIILQAGERISAIDIGLLASLGINQIPVYRKLKIAVFSTGDELLMPGEPARDDRIFDSNRAMLVAMASRLGADVLDLGVIGDNKDKIRAAFEQANAQADCVITSGGVSVGEADYTREILEEYGTVDFWKLAIKPGKPMAFGRLTNSLFFGLPGNPVSAAVTFDQIAVPALKCLAGARVSKPILLKAKASCTFKKRPGRTDYQRAFYYVDDIGDICVNTAVSQSSGVLSGFSASNCYAVLENERGRVEAGEHVQILLFDHIVK